MKILHIITQSSLGGAQSVVIELSNACIKDGHEVFVMAKTSGPMWDLLDKKVCAIKCDYFRRNISPLNELKSFFAIKRALKTINPDIIHLHTSKVGALGRFAAFPKYTKKVIYTMHGYDQIRVSNKKFLPIEKLLKNKCKKIVAISEYDKKNLLTDGIHNISLIINGTKEASSTEKNSEVVKKITDFANNRKIILTIARDAIPKRMDIYIELAKKLPQYCFFWIGNKNTYDDIPKNLLCLGEITNASAYLGLADLFVLISDHEGVPMSILEAFSSSVPAIASNVGGIPEIIDSSCGYVVENKSDEFAKKVKEILEDPTLFSTLKTNARKKYEQNFSVDKMAKSYLELYNS